MNSGETTCWSLVDAAAGGDQQRRQEFASRYYPVVSAYLVARWRGTPLKGDVEDGCQEVFAECFRENGPLLRADPKRGGFRAFLYGVTRNVALRVEDRKRRDRLIGGEIRFVPADETSLSQAFDRAWAIGLIKEAGCRQAALAANKGSAAVRRVELLQLRFRDGKPIRDIAGEWAVPATELHREYAKARKEFLDALKDLVAGEHPSASDLEVDKQCRELLTLLGRASVKV